MRRRTRARRVTTRTSTTANKYINILKKLHAKTNDDEIKEAIELELNRSKKSIIGDLSKDTKKPLTLSQYMRKPNRYDLLTLSEIRHKNVRQLLKTLRERLQRLKSKDLEVQYRQLKAKYNRLYREYIHYRTLADLEEIVRHEHLDEFLDLRFYNVLKSLQRKRIIERELPALPPNLIDNIKDRHKKEKWIREYDLLLDYLKEHYHSIFDGVKDKLLALDYELTEIEQQLNQLENLTRD